MAGVECGIYVLRNGLLYLAMPGMHSLCIPDTKVEGGRGKKDGTEKKNLREMLIRDVRSLQQSW